ncbi:MAG: hypothetical protein DLM60_23600 [Pseudonocardiales bacterium]|nr:MAG: hypothetical protein DLM60_23600 [Pseudonocardiales bacterium]
MGCGLCEAQSGVDQSAVIAPSGRGLKTLLGASREGQAQRMAQGQHETDHQLKAAIADGIVE